MSDLVDLAAPILIWGKRYNDFFYEFFFWVNWKLDGVLNILEGIQYFSDNFRKKLQCKTCKVLFLEL